MAVNRLGHFLAPPASQTNQNSAIPVGFALCPVFFVQLPAAQLAAFKSSIARHTNRRSQGSHQPAGETLFLVLELVARRSVP